MTHPEKLKAIVTRRKESKHAERICSELTYLDALSALRGGIYDEQLEQAADLLLERIADDGVITAHAVAETESALSDLAPAAKSLKEIFVAHAHIDMNWQWGYNETAAITVDTFRTMLALMREYPDFTFAQSQASTYEIIEKYRPDLLPEIRERIREGRWEVTAAEWVEPDKNMPSGESLTRQLLEARKYLTHLLEIPAEKIRIDFVPDTFGHAITVPEILADAGIRYLYHCRGSEGPCFYRYRAPSGKEILAYREYGWYNKDITPACFEIVPGFCAQEKLDTFLCVYGVGDHGGGPTRLDIERILEYRSWPLTPDIRFGTYGEFFDIAACSGIDFPIVDKERNFLFAGCYTTQARIKMANRIAEARAFEAESLAVAATALTDVPCDPTRFETPWRNILFNHFHDILPGSGTVETREYALGRFQETLATLQTSASASMQAIADRIDTSSLGFDEDPNSRAEGGGVGFATGADGGFRLPSAERGRGAVRAIHVFNPTAYERDEVTEITVWDYNYDPEQTVILDDGGIPLPFTLLADVRQPNKGYWGHTYRTYLVRVRVPALGYTTLTVRQRPYEGYLSTPPVTYEHTDHTFVNDAPIVLENEKIRAVFEKSTGRLTELFDKRTQEMLIHTPSCFFRAIEENPVYGFIAWRIGPYSKVTDLNACGVRLTSLIHDPLYSRFSYVIDYGRSSIRAEITLRQNSEMLEYALTVDFKEDAIHGKSIPQLAFAVPVSYRTDGTSLSEIPYGTLVRPAMPCDIPTHGALGINGHAKHTVALLADTKYGFRCDGGEGQITLLRNAYHPDPYSDSGIHHIRLGVAACASEEIGSLSSRLCHSLPYVSGQCHSGTLPTSARFASLKGKARLSALKPAEDGAGFVARLYSVCDTPEDVTLTLATSIRRAALTDTAEQPLDEFPLSDGTVNLTIPPRAVVTVKLIP